MLAAILQARTSSTRLPGKVMEPVLGAPMVVRQLERVRRCRTIDRIILATSTEPSDDLLASLCDGLEVDCFRGNLDDVLGRFCGAAVRAGADHVVRLTADCPLADPDVIDAAVLFYREGGYDYASNVIARTYPKGLDVEVFSAEALFRADREALAGHEREHVTPYFYQHPELFQLGDFRHSEDLSAERWTVDHPEDLELIRRIYEALYPNDPAFGWRSVLGLLQANPDWRSINAHL